jgi:hypothetical protein
MPTRVRPDCENYFDTWSQESAPLQKRLCPAYTRREIWRQETEIEENASRPLLFDDLNGLNDLDPTGWPKLTQDEDIG